MLHTTRAVVLRTIRHGDRTTVLKAHTERSGTRSYLIRVGGRSGVKPALVSPLTRVELVEDERPERDLHHVRELRMEAPAPSADDPRTGALLLFTQDILLRCLKEEVADPALFAFIHDHLGELAASGGGPMTPIRFLIDLSRHLGFHPSPPGRHDENFDLMEGCFVHGEAPSGYTLRPPLSAALASCLEDPTGDPALPPGTRRGLLDHLLLYYRLHVPGFGELRSVDVLREVLT